MIGKFPVNKWKLKNNTPLKMAIRAFWRGFKMPDKYIKCIKKIALRGK